jgi:hypothetical protein
MEDVLDVYAEPPDPERPVVCVDERPYQLVGEVTPPEPCAPGQPAREDYEYERKGTCNLFLSFCPAQGARQVEVTERRTAVDFAHFVQEVVDIQFPEAEVIRLVVDNLNTHRPASFYKAFPPEEARRLARKIEWHYTPEHGSWLNQAEIEFAVLSKQCLARRLPDRERLAREVAAWEAPRNAAGTTIKWRFQTTDARIKLRRLYPVQP